MRNAFLVTGMVLFAMLPAWAAEAKQKEEDPWIGKTRAEVVEMLGKPQKVGRPGRDGERLTYKFFRIDPELPLPLDMRMILVPGLGMVAAAGTPATGNSADVAIGPTEFDKHGRGTTGGNTTESVSRTYELESGKLEHSGPQRSAVLGKVKLLLVLDRGGLVTSWSVSGKK